VMNSEDMNYRLQHMTFPLEEVNFGYAFQTISFLEPKNRRTKFISACANIRRF
jgi:hypothetical protein